MPGNRVVQVRVTARVLRPVAPGTVEGTPILSALTGRLLFLATMPAISLSLKYWRADGSGDGEVGRA